MVTIAEYTDIVSAAGMLVLATVIFLQLRHSIKLRNMEISMKLFEWAESDRLRKAFKWIENEFEFADHELKERQDFEASDYPYEVTAFFEQVGFLVEKNFVDIDVIDDRLGSYIISNWRKLEPWILTLRKTKDDQTFGEHFERLFEKTLRYMSKR
jgi:hypothetical protein